MALSWAAAKTFAWVSKPRATASQQHQNAILGRPAAAGSFGQIAAQQRAEITDNHNRVLNYMARGVLSRTDDASEDGMQLSEVTLLADEAKVEVERFQQYGFTANPPVESECVVLFHGGGRDHGIVMSVDNRVSRLPGQAVGEVSIYSDEGDFISLKRGNIIEIVSLTIDQGCDHYKLEAHEDASIRTTRLVITGIDHVTIKAPTITLDTPTVRVTGDVRVDGDVIAGNVSLRNHRHTGGTASGFTGAPVP